MSRENKSRYAVMGILNMRPMSGYDIKKTIEAGLGNFWSESYGQIYPILRALVADGLATASTQEQTGRPDRHVYALTDEGQAELARWLVRPLDYEPGRIEILLKLFFGWQMPPEESAKQVQQHRDTHQALLQKYGGIEEDLRASEPDHPGLPYWLMTISYGKHISKAIVDWCNETLDDMQTLDADHRSTIEHKEP